MTGNYVETVVLGYALLLCCVATIAVRAVGWFTPQKETGNGQHWNQISLYEGLKFLSKSHSDAQHEGWYTSLNMQINAPENEKNHHGRQEQKRATLIWKDMGGETHITELGNWNRQHGFMFGQCVVMKEELPEQDWACVDNKIVVIVADARGDLGRAQNNVRVKLPSVDPSHMPAPEVTHTR